MANVGFIVVLMLATALFVGALSMLVFPIQPQLTTGSGGGAGKTTTVSITLYAGEVSASKYGFGTSPNNITSPGPTLRFKTSDVVNLTIVNAGQYPHALAVTTAPKTGARTLFGATIASGSSPLGPGQSENVIFSPNSVSQDYYICPVPGHAELGMWGSIIVSVG
jgi:uncharacterized cupredoxin-like copper-binding protein